MFVCRIQSIRNIIRRDRQYKSRCRTSLFRAELRRYNFLSLNRNVYLYMCVCVHIWRIYIGVQTRTHIIQKRSHARRLRTVVRVSYFALVL